MKSINSDMHVHTHYSCDSQASMNSYCAKAVETGVDTICFTDHVDFNPHDDGIVRLIQVGKIPPAAAAASPLVKGG
jgi:histidinol phosphatase-like PHP family hydrolase